MGDNDTAETFGQRLRRLREERGFSVPELASAVGASEGTIRQLETGQVKSPAFLLGLRLATKLSVDPYYLALGSGFDVMERFEVVSRQIADLQRRVTTVERATRPSTARKTAR